MSCKELMINKLLSWIVYAFRLELLCGDKQFAVHVDINSENLSIVQWLTSFAELLYESAAHNS